MHEALITRGNAQGTPDPRFIYVAANCVLRHHVCPDGKHSHTSGTGGDDVWAACARQIIEFEGREAIEEWLNECIREGFAVAAVHDALQRLKGV